MFNLEKVHSYDRKLALGRVLLVVLLVTSLLIFTTQIVNITTTRIHYANAAVNESDKPGNVVNSKYLSITDYKYGSGQFYHTITEPLRIILHRKFHL